MGELARRQHGVVERSQLIALGFTLDAIEGRVKPLLVTSVLPLSGKSAKTQRTCPAVVVHQSPLKGQRVRRDGIVVTTVGRTLVDLADVVHKRRTLERAFDEAEYLKLDWQSATPIHGRTGCGLLSSVLAVHEPGTTRTLSDLEEDFLTFCDHQGFPRPEVSVSFEGYPSGTPTSRSPAGE